MKSETYLDLLKALEVRDPEGFCENTPKPTVWDATQLAFLRQAWLGIPHQGDEAWLDLMSRASSGGESEALTRLLEAGASKQDLVAFLRGHLIGNLWHICYLLGDPVSDKPELEHLRWGLWGEDASGNPVRRLTGSQDHVDAFDHRDFNRPAP